MPKKAPQTDAIDPVRSRLAGAVAGPPPKASTPTPNLAPASRTPSTPQKTKPKEPPRQRSAPAPSSMTVNRKFMVTPQEAAQIKETLDLLAGAFGSKITLSQATRAMWTILAGSEDAMRATGRRHTKRSAPSTGNALAMAEYEEEVAEFLEVVLKRS